MRVQEHSHISSANVKPFKMAMDSVNDYQSLSKIGIGLEPQHIQAMSNALGGVGMDADFTTPVTTASVTTPIQFLQSWLPGFVEVATTERKIDKLLGITTQGGWADQEVIQGIMEYTGSASVYGDTTNIPLSSWNVNYERRTVVRFEEGLRVGKLEEARAAKIRANSAEGKREAAARALDITRNRVGFFGYNDGNGRTYGMLNDPQLPPYTSAPTGSWSTSTFLEITADIRASVAQLRQQSGDTIDPTMTPIKLAIATSAVDFLSVTSDFGNSVYEWLKETYPNITVESVPEFDSANGGDNVFYLYAETVDNSGTDDSRSIIQVVPARFQTIGVEQQAKAYVEDYLNATAGVMVKRPYAIVRYSGI